MSRTVSMSSSKNRPSPLSTKSFTRYEPPKSPPAQRSRANTVQSPAAQKSPRKQSEGDVFEKNDEEDDDGPVSPALSRSSTLPDKFDELPIELASLTDRFIDSLTAKVHNEPPSIDYISGTFQDFYVRAAASISIHISALMSRINRTAPIPPATAGVKSRPPHSRESKDALASLDKASAAQQMLTASEVTEKRRARKVLEYKRLLLEEAVEKRATEKIYHKIWRHRSTLDEVRDEKLRSKTAALALVGIGLKDLGIELDDKSTTSLEDIQEALTPAREGLARMDDEHSPLGKLHHLQTAHKAIVDTLYSIHPSGSSADEILPTLIYTLITSPIEGINIISNLNFIQRFRTASKIDGEAAYCITNLEAAISFLENVDLASLREDEKPEGPAKDSRPGTPAIERPDPFPSLALKSSSPSVATTSPSPSSASGTNAESSPTLSKAALVAPSKALPAPRHNRTFSDLLQPITTAPAAARRTAEESIETISSTLDNSFKFLFSKLREKSADDSSTEVIVPKTLDEARQLVSRPLTPEEVGDTISDSSSFAEKDETAAGPKMTTAEEKILNLMGGRKRAGSLRDRSVDSQRSNTSASGKKVAFEVTSGQTRPLGGLTPTATSMMNPLDSVKNFGNSINPINHIGSAFGGAFRSFGQRTTSSDKIPATASPVDRIPSATLPFLPPPTSAEPEILLRPPTADELPRIQSQAPIARFMVTKSAAELKLGEIQELLDDYQRLAKVIENLKIVAEEERQQHQEEDAVVESSSTF